MLLARYGIIPPKYFEHDPELENDYNQTVAIILADNGIIPPDNWMHDIDIEDDDGYSIRSNLLKHRYGYINGQFIKFEDTDVENIKLEDII